MLQRFAVLALIAMIRASALPLFLVFALCAAANAAVTVHVSEVDAGQNHSAFEVSTPWGDYVAIDRGGGDYWIGTYSEYEHARVVGITRDLGLRESTVKLDGATTFVQKDSLKSHVGDAPLEGITPRIDFESQADISTSRVVDVMWLDGPGHPVTCFFYAPSIRRSFYPDPYFADRQGGFRNEGFNLPKSVLSRPVLLIYLQHGQKPTVIPIHSLARLDYALSYDAAYGMDMKPDAGQARHLKYLRLLDPSIPLGPVPTPAPTRPPGSYLSLDGSYTFVKGDYPWTCVDVNTGDTVVVNRGDPFELTSSTENQNTCSYDETYSIRIRPSPYARRGYNAMCKVDAHLLNRMAGATP